MRANYNFGKIRKRFYPFLWFIAAIDEEKICRCPIAEQDKQAGIGMAIVCTALAALLSGYFAFHSFINQWYAALPLGFFWSIIILNLDRVMVSTMKKDPNGNRSKELLTAIPRIILAVLIAILITKPIETKLFKNQIDTKKNSVIEADVEDELRQQEKRSSDNKVERGAKGKEQKEIERKANDCSSDPGWVNANEEYNSAKTQYDDLESRLSNKVATLRNLYTNGRYSYTNQYNKRVLNASGRSAKEALNSDINRLRTQQREFNYTGLKKIADSICSDYRVRQDNHLSNVDRQLAYQDSIIAVDNYNSRHQRDSIKAIMQDRYADVFGQLRILRVIKGKDNSMYLASLLIMALFFAVETAPIFVKIISSRGEYDVLLYVEQKKAFDREKSDIRISEDELRVKIESSGQNTQTILQKEKEINEQIMSEVLEAGASLGKRIIKKWEERESKKMDEDPDAYLNEIMD